jgi:outer membrane protein assembly factor BamE (lipoprotein component of BamABCDE complex)
MLLMDSKTSLSRRAVMWTIAGASASVLAGCSSELNRRGYRPKPGALAQVRAGMAKTEVEGIMGSPSTTASINYQGDSYYYISSTTSGRAFLRPTEVNREIIAIRFDQNEQVTSVAQYALEDGRVFNVNDRKTPILGQELNILNELFKNTKPGLSL